MVIDTSALIAPAVTVALGLITFYGMVSSRLARIETKMDDLADDVRKHNGVVERTSVLERDMVIAFDKYDELHKDMRAMSNEMHRLQSK